MRRHWRRKNWTEQCWQTSREQMLDQSSSHIVLKKTLQFKRRSSIWPRSRTLTAWLSKCKMRLMFQSHIACGKLMAVTTAFSRKNLKRSRALTSLMDIIDLPLHTMLVRFARLEPSLKVSLSQEKRTSTTSCRLSTQVTTLRFLTTTEWSKASTIWLLSSSLIGSLLDSQT